MQQSFDRNPSMAESYEKLELFVSCRSLINMDVMSKSDPFVVFKIQKNNQWLEYGRTETIMDNLNPNFAKTFQIDYHFEIKQPLRFEVFDYDGPSSSDVQNYQERKFIGTVDTTLGAIAGSRDQIFVADILGNHNKKNGKLIIRADQVKLINDEVQMHIAAKDIIDTRFWFWHSTCPFLRFYRLKRDTSQHLLVHETEPKMNNKSPTWNTIRIKAQKLCNGDYDMPIKVELWDYRSDGSHAHLGTTTFTVNELKKLSKTAQFQFFNNKKAPVGTFLISNFQLHERPSFIDYIAGGTQLNLIVAIDFTASNQNPHHPTSLHYIDPNGTLNQYQQAIMGVGEILLNYDHDQRVPVFGFGCKPNLPNLTTNQTMHCFPLNGNPQDPEVFALDGIMQLYANTLRFLRFDGPTYFNPIISEACKQAEMVKEMNGDCYFILLIITDGEIHDMRQTINTIVDASKLPISIIIIGVGNADFGNMQILDNDDGSMKNDNGLGQRASRDLVQFIPFNEYKNNPELLAKAVLQELPDQLVQYMVSVGRKPGERKQIDLRNYNPQMSMGSAKPNQGVQNFGNGLIQAGFLNQAINQANQQQQYPQYQQPPPNYPSQAFYQQPPIVQGIPTGVPPQGYQQGIQQGIPPGAPFQPGFPPQQQPYPPQQYYQPPPNQQYP